MDDPRLAVWNVLHAGEIKERTAHSTVATGRGIAVLQNAHCARDQQNYNHQRDQNLNHREYFSPARQERRVGRSEGGTLGEGNEQIIDEPWSPVCARKFGALVVRNLHLRKKETRAAESLLFPPQCRPAAIESPVPE